MRTFDSAKGTFEEQERQRLAAEQRRLHATIAAAHDGAGAEAHARAGSALMELGRFDEARRYLDRALRIDPRHFNALAALSTVLTRSGEVEQSLAVLDLAEQVLPGSPQVLVMRASRLAELGHDDEAAALFEKAAQIDSSSLGRRAAQMVSHHHLMCGRFEEGWRLHERRPDTESMERLPFPRWNGEPRSEGDTRVVVLGEQGLGDMIQFARYVPMIAQRGWPVSMVVDRRLAPLLRSLDGVDSVEAAAGLSKGDRYAPIMSLPYVFGTRRDAIPNAVPYLRAPADSAESWRQAFPPGQRPRIGICWAGNPQNTNNHNRSIPLELLTRLFGADATFVSLQHEIPDRDRAVFRDLDGIRRIGHQVADFADTAGVIANLDLVISVCTAIAHLSGALGKPTWILLQRHADWRWFQEGDDSPWYPTARLFRQSVARDWNPVIERVAAELQKFCASHRA